MRTNELNIFLKTHVILFHSNQMSFFSWRVAQTLTYYLRYFSTISKSRQVRTLHPDDNKFPAFVVEKLKLRYMLHLPNSYMKKTIAPILCYFVQILYPIAYKILHRKSRSYFSWNESNIHKFEERTSIVNNLFSRISTSVHFNNTTRWGFFFNVYEYASERRFRRKITYAETFN